MALEIERKFLVKGDFKKDAKKNTKIIQGYLSIESNCTIRVRIKGKKGFITVKGTSNESGLSRYEWEKEIPKREAKELLMLCEDKIIEKKRYLVDVGTHTYEVDVFCGKNKNLIIAEIELNSEDEYFEKPKWLGKEVTGDIKYYNSVLLKNPIS